MIDEELSKFLLNLLRNSPRLLHRLFSISHDFIFHGFDILLHFFDDVVYYTRVRRIQAIALPRRRYCRCRSRSRRC